MNALRAGLVCSVIGFFVAVAVAHEDPIVLLVGLFPVAWIAVELLWRGLKP